MIDTIQYIGLSLLVIMFIVELVHDWKERKQLYNRQETLNNICIGLVLIFSSFISKGVLYGAFQLSSAFQIFDMQNTFGSFLLLIMLSDFSYYWYHRISHTVAWFWAAHSVHHSASHYNISITFRQSWTNQLSGQFLFWLWLPFVGFDPTWVFASFQLCMVYQTWLHTELISKLHPVFEFIFNTPSHHRVHHGSNLNYLDKNHGGILIIWDRLFGTFQEETERPVYGLSGKKNPDSLPEIMWSEWKQLFKIVGKAGSFCAGIKCLFQPPGLNEQVLKS